MFLVAFACTVTSIEAANSFQCSNRTVVQLAAVHPASAVVPTMLLGRKLTCQGFDSARPGQLIATCRFKSGRDVACALVDRGILGEVADKQRQYALPNCAERAGRAGRRHGPS